MLLSALILLSSLLSPAQAADAVSYRCRIYIAATDLPNGGYDETFIAKVNTGAHGGEERRFRAGRYEVATLADGRWMGISWFRDDEKIAEGVYVYSGSDSAHRAFILYNPKNSDEQVSLDCSVER